MVDEERIAPRPRRRRLDEGGGRGPWSTRPTGPAAATTSPRSPSGSSTPPLLSAEPEGATLVGPSAEAAGLTATEVRRRAAAEAARERREKLGAQADRRRRLRSAAKALAVLVVARRDRVRRLVRAAPGLVPRHRLRRAGRPLSRPALRAARSGSSSMASATRSPIQTDVAAAAPPRIGHRPRAPLPRRRRLADRRHRSLAMAEGSSDT